MRWHEFLRQPSKVFSLNISAGADSLKAIIERRSTAIDDALVSEQLHRVYDRNLLLRGRYMTVST
jgi:hypothetical protein